MFNMAVTTNLYPPIIDTYMPAFLIGDVDTTTITKTYTVLSYVDQDAYDTAFDKYIKNSEIDGVQELWDEYEAKLAEIRSQGTNPDEIEEERLLKQEYHLKLRELIAGAPNEDRTEDTFFEDRPDPVEIQKSTTFETANTTKRNFICRVYFSLSQFNSTNEIQNAQVTVRSQATNKSVLHKTKYPCEIMIKKLKVDNTKFTDDKYYIEIKPEDLDGCNFIVDQYYKVQIRFTSTDAEDPGIDLDDSNAIQAIDDWLSKNLNYFSEWSSVCLIRGISIPTITIKDFSEGSLTEIYDTIINTQLIGDLTFADDNETETLRSYRVKVYDSDDKLLLDSGDQLANEFTDTNHFNYAIKYYFQAGNSYYFDFTYTTQNLYTETHEYSFSVIQADTPDLNLQVIAYKDEENGCIGMRVNRSRVKGKYTGQLIIRRASSKDNFTLWDDMYITTYDHAAYIDFTWNDYTIESGVWYLYGIQGVDTEGARTPMIMFKEPVMVVLNDIFLLSGDRQLKVEFNPSLTSFKRTLSESRVETIGSKYPYIKRNGYVDYVQFPLGGLISSAIDEDETFTSKDELYGDMVDYYSEYNDDNDISSYQDMVWEKIFRDKVMDFLYTDDVKLFRSPTEGNYLVRIMDVQLQPNQTLGRRLWSFTSTAYEVDECNVDNYVKYGIYTQTAGSTYISSSEDQPSTLSPIRRVVFADTYDELPTTGKERVLYVCDGDFYLWDEDVEEYNMISVTVWDQESSSVMTAALDGEPNTLYADDQDLYIYDDKNEEYRKISTTDMEG
jgi:hypothetical protein